MMRRNGKLTVATVLAILLATYCSDLVYWRLLVPRLSQYLEVPILWWIAVYSPFGVACLILGFLSKAPQTILVNGIAASLTASIGGIVLKVANGRPPGHDMSWLDMMTLIYFLIMLAFEAIVFSIVLYAGYTIHLGVGKFRPA